MNINKIKLSGTTYNIQDENATKTVELTQAQYDALSTKDPNTFYIITDATAGDLSNYYTKLETSGATQISTALASKADTATTYTKTEVDNAITAATSTKQDQLVSGSNIKTINNESILGEGNITIEGGGGKAINAGRGIAITTGETADTVSFNLPISAGTGTNSVIFGDSKNQSNGSCAFAGGSTSSILKNEATKEASFAFGINCKANGDYSHAEGFMAKAAGDASHAEGYNTKANGTSSHAEGKDTTASSEGSHAEGRGTTASGNFSHAEGYLTRTNNQSEHASGQYNNSVSASTTFGDSGNTLFSVGNGTSDSARHNAFEIRQNGDIYLTKDGQDVKLQDQLGGGSITVDTALDSGSTNPVENRVIYNKIDEVEQVTAAALNELNEILSGKADSNSVYSKTEANVLLDGKLDVTAYTPTDLSNYYTKSETSGATQISTALDDKLDTSNFNTYTAATNSRLSEDEEVTAAGLNALNDNFGGLKLVKLSQSEYDALATKDSSTLYIIVN